MDYNNFVKKYNSDTFDNYIIEANKIGDLHKRIKYWKTLYLLFEKEKSNISRQNSSMGLRITLDPELRLGNTIMSINFGGLCEEEIKLIEFELKTFIPSKKTLNKITYQWQNNPNKELPKLHSLMLDKYKLIASETTLESFTAIFRGQPIDSVNPIKWLVNKSLLAYFIDTLYDKNKLDLISDPEMWNIAKKCFANGTNLSQSKYNYSNSDTGKPKNYHIIDELINTL